MRGTRAMHRLVMAASLLSACGPAQAAPAGGADGAPGPALSAVLVHETRVLGTDGVIRTTQYRERFTRDGAQIWMQRLVPASAPKVHADGDGHEHPDFTLAGRHITRGPDGRARLALVLAAERIRVPLAPVDHEEAGFSDCWPCAAHLVDPAVLVRMRRVGGGQGLVRYERREQGVVTRILWDERLGLPREVVSRRLDGSREGRMRVEGVGAAAARPWLAATGYRERSMADFGD